MADGIYGKVKLTYKNKPFFKSGNSDLNLKIDFKPTEADL